MIRRGGITDIPWFLAAVGNKVSHACLINTSPHCKCGSVISQLRVLASHKTNFESVAHGTLELDLFQIRKCHFLSDPCVFGYIF